MKPRIAVLAWAVAAVSVAGFIAAWVLAARNRNLLGLSANFGPDRFLVAYAVVGGVVASRRSSNPIGWFLLGTGLVTACRALAGEYALYALAGSARPASGVWAAWFVNWSLTLLFPGGLVTFLLLQFPNGRPVSARWWTVGWIGVGYAIDKIISRTVSYALVTGLVVGVYLRCVALLTKILPFRGSVGIAGAVLAAAAIFNPLRRRVQAMVDRRFDRARYDAERVVTQFSVHLREQVDLDVLGNDLLGVVNHVLAPAHVTLWLSREVPPGGNAEQDTVSTPEIPALPRSLAVPVGGQLPPAR
ncbi:MAG: hypothetical protein ACRDOU_10475 [Streptosporangiaceae bacterium]